MGRGKTSILLELLDLFLDGLGPCSTFDVICSLSSLVLEYIAVMRDSGNFYVGAAKVNTDCVTRRHARKYQTPFRQRLSSCRSNSKVNEPSEPQGCALAHRTGRLTPVSYTHLRAHEAGRNLVCRLLLEKKKKIKRENIRKDRLSRADSGNEDDPCCMYCF